MYALPAGKTQATQRQCSVLEEQLSLGALSTVGNLLGVMVVERFFDPMNRTLLMKH